MRIAFASLALTACGPEIRPDRAELVNMRFSNQVPKSSPAQLVGAFDRHCINGENTREAQEAELRAASYVPRPTKNDVQLFLVDNRRPAVALTDRICMVKARSRTGQTERFTNYVAETFPDATPLDKSTFSTRLENAWAVRDPAPGIIATERRVDRGNETTYALIHFRADKN
ncbi:hypothetical protein ACS3SW_15810 [Roseobacteraceae bacterium S113]